MLIISWLSALVCKLSFCNQVTYQKKSEQKKTCALRDKNLFFDKCFKCIKMYIFPLFQKNLSQLSNYMEVLYFFGNNRKNDSMFPINQCNQDVLFLERSSLM